MNNSPKTDAAVKENDKIPEKESQVMICNLQKSKFPLN
jgi:hypothetical protein